MITIETIDRVIRKVTGERLDSRPFLCDGNPIGAEVLLAGLNPGTTTPFWPYWSLETGCDKKRWLQDFGTYSGGEKTRTAIELFLKQIAPIKYVETNLYCVQSFNLEDLSGSDRSTKIFHFLVKRLTPKIIVTHGADTRRELSKIINDQLPYKEFIKCDIYGASVEVISYHHFTRVSHKDIVQLGTNIRSRLLEGSDVAHVPTDTSKIIPTEVLKKCNENTSLPPKRRICDSNFSQYLKKNADYKVYRPFSLGKPYKFMLSPASNPTSRFSEDIIVYFEAGGGKTTVPPIRIEEFIDKYNAGDRSPSDYVNHSIAQSRSKRGRFTLGILLTMDEQI